MITRSALIAEAREWIGTRYRHQASVKGVACDCLGLIRGLYRFAYGQEPVKVPPYSSDWAETAKVDSLLQAAQAHLCEIAVEDARPGDVLLFRWRAHLPAKHCALLVAPGRIVHAHEGAGRIYENNLALAWKETLTAAFSFPGIEGD